MHKGAVGRFENNPIRGRNAQANARLCEKSGAPGVEGADLRRYNLEKWPATLQIKILLWTVGGWVLAEDKAGPFVSLMG